MHKVEGLTEHENSDVILEVVTKLTREDSERIIALAEDNIEYFPNGTDSKRLRKGFNQHESGQYLCVGRDESGEIVGYINGDEIAPDQFIVRLFVVDPAYRNTYIAQRLILALGRQLREKGYKKVHVHAANPELERILEREKFIEKFGIELYD